MVAHRLVEALRRPRRRARRGRSPCSPRSRAPPYDRVALTSYFSGRDPDDLALGDAGAVATTRGSPCASASRSPRSTARPATVDHAGGADARLRRRWCSPPARTPFVPPVAGQGPARAASSTGPSTTSPTLRAVRRATCAASSDRPVARRGRRRRPARPRGGRRAAALGVATARRRVRAAADAAAGRRGRRRGAAPAHRGPRRHRAHRRPRPRRMRAGADGAGRRAMEFADGAEARRRRRRLRRRHPPARRARPRRRAAVGERGGIVVDDGLPHRATRPSTRSASAPASSGRDATAWSRPATRWPRSSPTGCSAASATFPGADLSTKLKLLGVDVASFGDAFARHRGRARGRLRRPGRRRLQEARASPTTRRRCSAASWSATPRAYAALRPLVGRAARRRPGGMTCCPEGAAPAPARRRCPTTRTSAPATTSSAGRDPRRGAPTTAAPTSAAVKACTKAGTSCGSCVPLVKKLVTTELAAAGVDGQHRAVRALRRSPARSCSTSSGSPGIAHLHRARRAARHAAAAATSASRSSPRSWPASAPATSSTASRPRCRTPTTTSWPTCRRTAPTRWCRGSPAARSPRRS